MKKFLLMLAVAVLPIAMFNACGNDDNNDDKRTIAEAVAGTYTTNLYVSLSGVPLDPVTGAKITFTKLTDDKVDLSLTGFTLPGIGTIPVQTSGGAALTGTNKTASISYRGTIDVPEPVNMQNLPIVISGTIKPGKKDLDLKITLTIKQDVLGNGELVDVPIVVTTKQNS